MASVRLGSPDLTGGVSRQAPGLRYSQQVEECVNCLAHFVRGLENRPSSTHVALLSGVPNTVGSKIKIHKMNVSATEQFFIVFKNDASNPVLAFKVDGTAITVNYAGSGGDVADLKSYLNSTSPSTDIRTVTIGDSVIVANTAVVTALTGSATSYTFGVTNVRNAGNAHNKATWQEFDFPPTITGEYWFARESSIGHPYGVWISNSTTNPPHYLQVVSDAANSQWNAATMPCKISWNGTVLTVEKMDWTPRYNGDDIDNPPPSFAGKKIRDLTFFRDRLWFGGDDYVVGSESGNYTNFWLTDSRNVVESDVIDLIIPSNDRNTIASLKPFQQSLLGFCKSGTVLDLRSDGPMAQDNASLSPTFFGPAAIGDPLIVNNRMYFASPYAAGLRLYEYLWFIDSFGGTVQEINNHCPGYIPDIANPMMEASVGNDMVFISRGPAAATGNLYVYSMYWEGDKRVQSAFHRWDFEDSIVGMFCMDNWLYLLLRRDGVHVRLEKVDISASQVENPNDIQQVLLDSKRKLTGTYSSVTNKTTFALPHADPTITTVWLGNEWTPVGKHGVFVEGTVVGSNLEVVGDFSTYQCWVGRPYQSLCELSKQVVRAKDGSVLVGALQLKQMSLQISETGYVEVEVKPTARPERVYTYTAKSVGNTYPSVNNISGYSQFNVPILASADGVRIRIQSSVPVKFRISGLEFTALFVPAKRSAASE